MRLNECFKKRLLRKERPNLEKSERSFRNDADQFIVKAVSKPEEIQGLLEVGFEYVCQKDDLTFFRKRK